ncbi:hypothetical protein [Nocardioides litoris]|uniref:hypothetical protein n=1 Tax=Nocardioides litoris TaxID=1926648 RepID=UPI00111D9B2B|nr:hypothetical protein [Nocardioides litoris]
MVGRTARPAEVTRVVVLSWVLLGLAAAATVLGIVLDDQMVRRSVGSDPDSTLSPPSFTPVVVVLDVTVTALVAVLLAFLRGGHNWARHGLTVTFGLTAVAAVGLLVASPLPVFSALAVAWVVLVVVLLVLLQRPGMAGLVAPAASADDREERREEGRAARP